MKLKPEFERLKAEYQRQKSEIEQRFGYYKPKDHDIDDHWAAYNGAEAIRKQGAAIAKKKNLIEEKIAAILL